LSRAASAGPTSAWRNGVLWPWRCLFIGYALALTTATHWPQVRLGSDAPASDKLIHLLAFGGLTLLLWQTRWIGRRWTVVLIALAWSLLDELTQGLMQRVVASDDMMANALGVLVAGSWLWALAAHGGPVNRLRLRQHAFVTDATFRRWSTWLVLALIFAASAALAAHFWRRGGPAAPFYYTLLGWALLSGLWTNLASRRERRRLEQVHPCFHCGSPCVDAPQNEQGQGQCPTCNGQVLTVQWIDFPPPTVPSRLRMAIVPALVGIGIFLLVYVMIILTALGYTWLMAHDATMTGPPRVAQFLGGIEKTMLTVIDIAFYGIVLALVIRLYRSRLGRFNDQSTTCRKCGHDLRATPSDQDIGTCGECGLQFVILQGNQ
jgi:hypothetical protein